MNPAPVLATAARRSMLWAGVGALAAAAGLGLWWKTQPLADQAAQAFWRLKLPTPSGSELSMLSLRGQLLVVNFWATWCPPCVEELPLLDRFYLQNSPKGIQVIGIAADKLEAVNGFLGRSPLHFPVALAGFAGIQTSKEMGNLTGGLPFTLVFGRDGAIIQRRLGPVQAEDLDAWTEWARSR
ncbi:MAG: hypothetical protein RLZZ126_1896 [Pseudomonadota bacterium]|jgi:thiol-disulfide isomerase/thioredoxin